MGRLPFPLRCAAWGAAVSVPFTLALVALYPHGGFLTGLMQEIVTAAAIFSALGLVFGLIGTAIRRE